MAIYSQYDPICFFWSSQHLSMDQRDLLQHLEPCPCLGGDGPSSSIMMNHIESPSIHRWMNTAEQGLYQKIGQLAASSGSSAPQPNGKAFHSMSQLHLAGKVMENSIHEPAQPGLKSQVSADNTALLTCVFGVVFGHLAFHKNSWHIPPHVQQLNKKKQICAI